MTGKILVTGSSGLVCSRFVELYPNPQNLLTPDELEFNLLQTEGISKYLSVHRPEVVINFAAFTDVSVAESQRNDQTGICWRVNVEGTKNLISCLNPAVHLIQISTDMVFSGSENDPGPYSETHSRESNSAQLTWYGYSKNQAEVELSPNHSIVRICNPVRSKFSSKLDYFRKPLSLFDEGNLYPLFSDQQVTITFIDEVANALQKIISSDSRGIFHVSSPDTTTPHEIISYLLEKTRRYSGEVASSSIASMHNPVRYPQYGGLKTEYTQKKLGLKFKTSKQIVDELISQGL